ncbi:MAG: 16S rRNA (cytidine(1402)-2'-O)-methyltransferase [Bacilli bacterium]|nr:16S rRNA (cytidine(1402)-2'-O)-methyltransferase [Bacilli bacterium]
MRSQNFNSNKLLLYLVATPIGNLSEMSPRAIETLQNADIIACEDTRVTGKLLSFFNIKKPLVSLREHNEVSEAGKLITRILAGEKVAYASDAGYPCISDPGAKLVQLALQNGINVSTISGPNAGLNALVASGLDTSHFYFHGFLNAKESVARNELQEMIKRKETIILYEAPHRIMKTLNMLFEILGDRQICLARELTKQHEEFIRGTLSELVELDPTTLKGEMVLIVEGRKDEVKPDLNNEEIYQMVKNFVGMGMSTKDAIKRVSEITEVSKNQVYKIYHA